MVFGGCAGGTASPCANPSDIHAGATASYEIDVGPGASLPSNLTFEAISETLRSDGATVPARSVAVQEVAFRLRGHPPPLSRPARFYFATDGEEFLSVSPAEGPGATWFRDSTTNPFLAPIDPWVQLIKPWNLWVPGTESLDGFSVTIERRPCEVFLRSGPVQGALNTTYQGHVRFAPDGLPSDGELSVADPSSTFAFRRMSFHDGQGAAIELATAPGPATVDATFGEVSRFTAANGMEIIGPPTGTSGFFNFTPAATFWLQTPTALQWSAQNPNGAHFTEIFWLRAAMEDARVNVAGTGNVPVPPTRLVLARAGLWGLTAVGTSSNGATEIRDYLDEYQDPSSFSEMPGYQRQAAGALDGLDGDATLTLAGAVELAGRALHQDSVLPDWIEWGFVYGQTQPVWVLHTGCPPYGDQASVLMIDARSGRILHGFTHQAVPRDAGIEACNLGTVPSV